MLYPFTPQDFSHLEYKECVLLVSDLGESFFNQDPLLAYDVWKLREKQKEKDQNA